MLWSPETTFAILYKGAPKVLKVIVQLFEYQSRLMLQVFQGTFWFFWYFGSLDLHFNNYYLKDAMFRLFGSLLMQVMILCCNFGKFKNYSAPPGQDFRSVCWYNSFNHLSKTIVEVQALPPELIVWKPITIFQGQISSHVDEPIEGHVWIKGNRWGDVKFLHSIASAVVLCAYSPSQESTIGNIDQYLSCRSETGRLLLCSLKWIRYFPGNLKTFYNTFCSSPDPGQIVQCCN